MARLYALLVGINDYPGDIGKLQGCLNDVDNVENYLIETFADPAIRVLKDHAATRAELARQFREHLGEAKAGDTVLFHYCGHGARSVAAPEFLPFELSGKDEGLVCIDSRADGSFDFADKELARLIEELAVKDRHIAILLDCCQSGSGTRSMEGAAGAGVRATAGTDKPRPLETYLDGYFAARAKSGQPLAIPASRHMLLAACERRQTAKEDLDTHNGIFTTTLFDILRHAPDQLSYADLFTRSRAAVRRYIREKDKTPQDPQFEAMAGFDGYGGFLGAAKRRDGKSFLVRGPKSYSAYFADDRWQVDCGAIHGLSTDPAQPVAFALTPEDAPDAAPLTATTAAVGAQKSDLAAGFTGDRAHRFTAHLTSLPAPPLLIGFSGSDAQRAALQSALDADDLTPVTLTDAALTDGYALRPDGDGLLLANASRGGAVRRVPIATSGSDWTANAVLLLRHVAQWERSLALANPRPKLDPALVDFVFAEHLDDGGEHVHHGPAFTLDYRAVDGEWRDVFGTLKLRNRTGQRLHFLLVHFSGDFGIQIVATDEVIAIDEWMTLTVGIGANASEVYFGIDGRADQSVECLKLIVSTERVDDWLLGLDPLSDTRSFGSAAKAPSRAAKPVENGWFVHDMRVTVVRRLDQTGPADTIFAGGQIRIKGHPGVTANLALSAAKSMARDVGSDAAFVAAMERNGITLVNVAGTRDAAQSILELTDIAHASMLAQTPLEIELAVPLAPGESLVPLVYDGQHVLLAGDSWLDDAGTTHVSIDRLPDIAIDRRSIGGALKMYLFKSYFGGGNVNRLRRVSFDAAGAPSYDDALPAHVAAAQSVLLVIHGIIGDTTSMLAGVAACDLHRQFDLVLAYDYENLSTPIEETARLLRDQLGFVGLRGDDGKALTILAHSMGGLVSRWFIEGEGGADTVDHLVMCGTPNGGSPFGRVDGARQILTLLATVSANYLPMVAGPALMLLSRSKNLTPTLEQMNPTSPFITALNARPDPQVRYTILAGDIDSYREPADAFFEDLLAKAGRSFVMDALFANKANDIAVGVDSILGLSAARPTVPVRHDVACHHLNYFTSAPGQAALRSVAWQG
jgi:hypothetical protein